MKRIVSIILAVAMIFSLALPSFAYTCVDNDHDWILRDAPGAYLEMWEYDNKLVYVVKCNKGDCEAHEYRCAECDGFIDRYTLCECFNVAELDWVAFLQARWAIISEITHKNYPNMNLCPCEQAVYDFIQTIESFLWQVEWGFIVPTQAMIDVLTVDMIVVYDDFECICVNLDWSAFYAARDNIISITHKHYGEIPPYVFCPCEQALYNYLQTIESFLWQVEWGFIVPTQAMIDAKTAEMWDVYNGWGCVCVIDPDAAAKAIVDALWEALNEKGVTNYGSFKAFITNSPKGKNKNIYLLTIGDVLINFEYSNGNLDSGNIDVVFVKDGYKFTLTGIYNVGKDKKADPLGPLTITYVKL